MGSPTAATRALLGKLSSVAADLTELLCDIVELDMTPSQSYIIMRLLRRGDRTNLAGTTTPFSMHQIHRQLPKVTSAIAFHVQILRSKESLLFDAKNEDTGEMEGFRGSQGEAPQERAGIADDAHELGEGTGNNAAPDPPDRQADLLPAAAAEGRELPQPLPDR